MEDVYKTIKQTRSNIMAIAEQLTVDQLLAIPAAHRNNIFWNLGHLIAAQQGLVYGRAGIQSEVNADFIKRYAKGSQPTADWIKEDWALIRLEWMASLDRMIAQHKEGVFASYNSYTTSYGVELNSAEEAIRFVAVHEAVHYGVVMSIKKLV